MTRRWGKLSKGVLCAAGKGGRTGLREGRLVPWPSKKKNEIPQSWRGGRRLSLKKMGLGLGLFFVFFSDVSQNCPPFV
jgi:hypothetical protein